MKVKPTRDLQVIVALATFPAALATAVSAPNGWLKWIVVVVLAVGGGVAEWMIERACTKAEKTSS